MATIGPEYGDWTDLWTPETLIKGAGVLSQKRAILDLSGAKVVGGRLWIGLGRGGTTALTTGVNIIVRPVDDDGKHRTEAAILSSLSQTVAALLKQINNAGNYAAGDQSITVDGTGTPAVEDKICIWPVTAIPTASGVTLANVEFHRVSGFAASVIALDAPLAFAQLDNYNISTKAESWGPIWLEGGCKYEVIADYTDDAAGEAVVVSARYMVYTDDLSS